MTENAKKTDKKSKKGRIKTLNLKRETKNLSDREQKKIKGGGGTKAGVELYV